MPSAALTEWQTIRMLRLAQIDGQCSSIVGLVPPNPDLLDESLRGYVMLLSAHFQGFCRTLYSECSQICAAAVSADFKATIQAQFTAALQLGKQNPSLKTVQADFERFGFKLKFPAIHASQITDLDHLNHWRNTAAHQRLSPPPPPIPVALVLASIQRWRASCDGLTTALDAIMRKELLRILGVAPW
jgi:hypothetical protein